MKEIQRYSPVSFKATPAKTENRDNWTVVMEYDGEGDGPYIVDLSHMTRLDLQSSDLKTMTPFGITIPDIPGQSVFDRGLLINRMNRTQASIWHLDGDLPDIPQEPCFTNVTEATTFLAIFGNNVFLIFEKLSALDFTNPDLKAPFLFQGPFSHVPCQITTLNKDGATSGILLTCSRGYAKNMVHSIMDAGKEFSLVPAGEDRFTSWIKSTS